MKIPIYHNFIEMKKSIQRTDARNEYLIEYLFQENFMKNLFNDPKYQDKKRLNKYEYQIYSDCGEDGIIEEIFNRIGTTNKFFVEFGCNNGLTGNTTALLIKKWNGVWIDSDSSFIKNSKNKFGFLSNLLIKESQLTIENIESIFRQCNVPEEFDLISIDVDGNEYWLWDAIKNYNPRLVIIEYNCNFNSNIKWVMKYNPNHVYDGSTYKGASLKSLELLGKKKDYYLVGCDLSGSNAFFIRQDLVSNKFSQPFTSENHYEPHRGYLWNHHYKQNFGEFVNI